MELLKKQKNEELNHHNTNLELRLKQLKEQLDTIQRNNPVTKTPVSTPKTGKAAATLSGTRTTLPGIC